MIVPAGYWEADVARSKIGKMRFGEDWVTDPADRVNGRGRWAGTIAMVVRELFEGRWHAISVEADGTQTLIPSKAWGAEHASGALAAGRWLDPEVAAGAERADWPKLYERGRLLFIAFEPAQPAVDEGGKRGRGGAPTKYEWASAGGAAANFISDSDPTAAELSSFMRSWFRNQGYDADKPDQRDLERFVADALKATKRAGQL